jgi:hypothetical protein
MRPNASVGIEKTRPRINDRDLAATQLKTRKPYADLLGREHLVRNVMLRRAAEHAAHKSPMLRPDHQSTRDGQQTLAGISLELVPQLVCAPQQRDVTRILEIDFANDPTLAMRRSARVPWRKLFEAKHALSAPREMTRRRATHGAESNDDDVERVGHRWAYSISRSPDAKNK